MVVEALAGLTVRIDGKVSTTEAELEAAGYDLVLWWL